MRAPVPPRSPTFRPRRNGAVTIVGVLALLACWESGVHLGLVSGLYFPPPSRILSTLARLLVSGAILPDLGATLGRAMAGALLGGLPAALLGLAMGWSERVRSALDPLVAALHPLPKITLLPLLMVLLGVGDRSLVAAVAIGAFFPMLLSASAGVRQISPIHFEVVRCYGGSPAQVFRRVVLRGSLPLILTGLRLSLNVAMLITIAAEMVAARVGLGRLIWLSWETFRTEDLYAGLVLISLLGIVSNAALHRASRRLVPWQPS